MRVMFLASRNKPRRWIQARAGDDANWLANLASYCHPYLSTRELARMWQMGEPQLWMANGEPYRQERP
jgi:hypothetical protein